MSHLPPHQHAFSAPIDPADLQRFERVRDVLEQIIDLPPANRAARLDELTSSDPPLRAAINELLHVSTAADRIGFLDDTQSLHSPAQQDQPPPTHPDSAPTISPTIISEIGPYKVLRRLGEGGTGIVYLAQSPPPLQRHVAIKLSRTSLHGHSSARASIEAQALASFNHPGIAQVYESGTLPDGRRWMACEYINGEPITSAAIHPWRTRIDLLVQVAQAVHHAHQQGVIHRDLKPSNILVISGTHKRQTKVIDFGIARFLTPSTQATSPTEPGLLVGTLAYMSPEQLAGAPVDARTDIYGLGLVACQLLSGALPPGRTGEGGIASLTFASQSPIKVTLSGYAGHEQDLEAIISKATNPDPSLRYASMQHFADDLTRVLNAEPIHARKPTLLWQLRLFTTRHPLLSLFILFVSSIIAALLIALSLSRINLTTQVQDQRQLISELVTDTLTGLRDVRGTREHRRVMVASLLDRLDRHIATSQSDPQLQFLRASLLRERGDISANMGLFEPALEDLNASRHIYETLIAAPDSTLSTKRLHAESIIRIGDVIIDRDADKGINETLQKYREAMAIQTALLKAHPDDINLLDDLCWSYDRIGSVGDHRNVTPDHELEPWLNERILHCERLLALDPNRTLSHYNLASGYLRIARFHGARTRYEPCAAAMAKGLPHIQRVVQSEPNRTAYILDYCTLLYWQLTSLLELQQLDKVPAATSLLVDTARLHARWLPGDILAEENYINALTHAAHAYAKLGNISLSREHATSAIDRLTYFKTIVSPIRHDEVDRKMSDLQTLLE